MVSVSYIRWYWNHCLAQAGIELVILSLPRNWYYRFAPPDLTLKNVLERENVGPRRNLRKNFTSYLSLDRRQLSPPSPKTRKIYYDNLDFLSVEWVVSAHGGLNEMFPIVPGKFLIPSWGHHFWRCRRSDIFQMKYVTRSGLWDFTDWHHFEFAFSASYLLLVHAWCLLKQFSAIMDSCPCRMINSNKFILL